MMSLALTGGPAGCSDAAVWLSDADVPAGAIGCWAACPAPWSVAGCWAVVLPVSAGCFAIVPLSALAGGVIVCSAEVPADPVSAVVPPFAVPIFSGGAIGLAGAGAVAAGACPCEVSVDVEFWARAVPARIAKTEAALSSVLRMASSSKKLD